MRAFVGIDFSKEVKEEVYEFQQKLRGFAQRGRWKHRDNFHLTLKFLDQITLTQRSEIDESLLKICLEEKFFNLELKGLGIFSDKESIRVLWLGLAGDIEVLESIHRKIDKALTPLGFIPERRSFKPHITIGQNIYIGAGFEEIKEIAKDFRFSPILVERIHLFKSEQVEHKRIYTKISDYPLLDTVP